MYCLGDREADNGIFSTTSASLKNWEHNSRSAMLSAQKWLHKLSRLVGASSARQLPNDIHNNILNNIDEVPYCWDKKSGNIFLFPALSKALQKVMACQCPYGTILGVLQGNFCLVFFALQNRWFRVANMYMVEDRDAHSLRYVYRCGCGAWESGSDLVCFPDL